MSSANQFRIAAIVIAVLMTVYALGSLLSLTFSPSQPDLPADPTKIATQDISRFARWTTLVSPFRTDLEANYATAFGGLLATEPACRKGRPTGAEGSAHQFHALADGGALADATRV
jgi:hypothetical protein